MYCTENLRFDTPKVGDRVQATAAAVMGKKQATQRYGANAKVKKLSGEIIHYPLKLYSFRSYI